MKITWKFTRICPLVLLCIGAILNVTQARAGDYPKPSLYPIAWELKFDHSKPKRITVKTPGEANARAYWYITYTVTNNGDKEQTFLPEFEMLTNKGRVFRSDNNISPAVFDAIKERERNRALQSALQIAGELRIGEDQAKEGVAIWPEIDPRMGTFTIFASGLSGEITPLKDDKGQTVKDKDGQPVILRKTLAMEYQIPGDEVHAGEDIINEKSEQWVMR